MTTEAEQLRQQLAATELALSQLREAIATWDRAESGQELCDAEAGLIRAMNAQPSTAHLGAYVEQKLKERMGEPVMKAFQGRDGKWCGFIDERHYENTRADGTWPIAELYAIKETP